MTACAISKQIELLFFDTILRLTSRTVESAVKSLWVAIESGKDVAWVRTLVGVLGFSNYTLLSTPSFCSVDATMKEGNAHNWLVGEEHLMFSTPVEANPNDDPLVATKGILLHH